MKQITPEIKARVFALYWGQDVYCTNEGYKGRLFYERLQPMQMEYAYLEVKPLSSITDEDALKAAELSNAPFKSGDSVTGLIEAMKLALTEALNSKMCIPIEVLDYLRSKGYALPYMDWSVDELVEAGVFKIKEVNDD